MANERMGPRGREKGPVCRKPLPRWAESLRLVVLRREQAEVLDRGRKVLHDPVGAVVLAALDQDGGAFDPRRDLLVAQPQAKPLRRARVIELAEPHPFFLCLHGFLAVLVSGTTLTRRGRPRSEANHNPERPRISVATLFVTVFRSPARAAGS